MRPEMISLLASTAADEKPVEVLHKAASIMCEASERVETGELDFDFFHEAQRQIMEYKGYDSDELERLLD